MPWDSSAMGTPVTVLNLWLLCTETRADRPQGSKDCCLSHILVSKAADFSAGPPRQQQITHCVSWLCTATAGAAADHPQCQQSTGIKAGCGQTAEVGQ